MIMWLFDYLIIFVIDYLTILLFELIWLYDYIIILSSWRAHDILACIFLFFPSLLPSTKLFHRIRFCDVLFAPSHVMLAFGNWLTFSRFGWVVRVLFFLAGSTLVPFAICYQVVSWACGLSIATYCAWFLICQVQ